MFIQVIQGRCTRQDELRALADSWNSTIKPTATGWLGGTFGFTDNDEFFGIVRFDTLENAMANSNRPEQGEFGARMDALIDGSITFHDYNDVTTFLDGGSDDAGFVQVIQGQLEDRSLLDGLLATVDSLREMRPEVIGGTFAVGEDGGFTQTVAFTDESSARAAEASTPPPPEVMAVLEKVMAGARYYDLHAPWFESA